jgi:hypothetical protein
MPITPSSASVWRRYEVDGVPASGAHPPVKTEVIAWGNAVESAADGALTAAAAVAPINNGLVLATIPKTANVTITIATGVVTWTAHGQPALTPLLFLSTGALPTGIVSGTVYFIVQGASLTTNSFRIATTVANAIAGVAITTSGSQSGAHTAYANYGIPYPYLGHRLNNTVPIAGVAAINGSGGQIWNSISLPPGRWRCGCQTGIIQAGGAPVFTHMHADYGIGTTSIQTAPANGATTAFHVTSNQANGWIFPHSQQPFYLPSGGTLNAVATADFTGGSAYFYGALWADLF